jgi:hypothetical protein
MPSRDETWGELTGIGSVMNDSYFDPEQLAFGIKIEMEHTHNIYIAKSIAKDHLMESPMYYKRLMEMKQDLETEKSVREVFGW